MGLPLIFCEHCRTVGDKGDIILTDWSQYLVGQKSTGLQFASSIHLKFDYDQTAFKFTLRIDGQPWWKQAMVPKNGTKTISPFIALAERSS
jgi:HK97 family phage major capsid protein